MKRFAFGFTCFLCAAISLYALAAYILLPPGALVHPDMRAAFQANAVAIRLHIFAAVLALALGPFQFSTGFRARFPKAHRLMGRFYLGVGVLIGGLAGLYIAQFAYGGGGARLGFAMLAVAWLYTGARAYRSIRAGRVAEHREWMMRNFALTFAAVTLRIYLPVSQVAGVPFETAYAAIAWLCWVPNLLAVEWWMRREGSAALTSNSAHQELHRSMARRV